LSEAVPMLRAIRREAASGDTIAVGAADPLNLTGSLLPGERIAALAANRIAFRDGVPVATVENGRFRPLRPLDDAATAAARRVLSRADTPAILRSYLKLSGGSPRLARPKAS
jgi:ATP-dependent Lhr-like helicase